ncbi:response regulator [Pararhizobium sp. DWP3-4]|uniref:response regulator n=1 Tax=Pararhizobium sp. DWP3-4 TaxID=2804565 RepID=UPI003CF9FDE0
MTMRNPVGNVDHRTCILVVEDELFLAMELETALTAGGFRVLGPAASVKDALDLLGRECPDAAVLDFNLGRDKVTPVALQLKSLGVPFVLASASSAAELSRYAVLADVANLGKPTDMKRLVAAVRALHA